jgi:pyruvate dehydrogenase E1 component alpha subunit
MTDADLAQIENEVARELDIAVDYAESGTFEPVADLMRDVMSPHPEANR